MSAWVFINFTKENKIKLKTICWDEVRKRVMGVFTRLWRCTFNNVVACNVPLMTIYIQVWNQLDSFFTSALNRIISLISKTVWILCIDSQAFIWLIVWKTINSIRRLRTLKLWRNISHNVKCCNSSLYRL